ncbi:ImpA family type VI secretion system protein [Pararhizobium arenae]|uniref:type VI secretion system protein TssA n=1 Tax=Pararhizobium arenae TaxID=1856850 RepID=UPI00094AF6EE|nr:type VI secretion system ImpA family N-terminal domain-containing protein [Pararhizobium arenae]
MTALQLEIYSKPIAVENPCGEALDYDLSFLELEIAAKGKPGHELGGSVVAPEPPDWTVVDRLAEDLSAKSKDLRVAVLAARSALALRGVGGFRLAVDGLSIYVEDFWSGLHPRPDSDSPDDEIIRMNALANLCDADGLLRELRSMPLSKSRSFGHFSLADWAAAQAAAAGLAGGGGPDIGNIGDAFKDTPESTLLAASSELAGATVAVSRIGDAVRGKVEATLAPNFQPLLDTLGQMRKLVADHLPVHDLPENISEAAPTVAGTVDIRDRNDVIAALDRICRWYRANEPSSPVPVLLERVKRVVAKDFMALLLELAPNGAAEFRALAGLPAEDDKSL